MMSKILEIAKNSDHVSRVSPWKDRVYLSLEGFDASVRGDRNLKVWIKGDILTVECANGSPTSGILASLHGLTDAIIAAGGERKGYSDSINATYTL
ncbi:hypothetical protein [Acetobacter sp. DsW_063]|uniref:hypothetical protein n=1 Tax=Acetobacter sp. DsW_063 TaxID=1514894 RepID=UPI000A3B210B|nr:hypothetical protein [Acetobacter sp. DsW_063]OUJ16469.1 hypothetical protein HK28_12360 [Acetobacter sp. DsW_063]